MKKIFLIFVCICLSHNFYGQQERNFTYFNHWIDSLALNFSMEKFVDITGAYVDFDNSNLKTEEKKKLIDKIEKLFQQKEYANLYRLGHRILRDMWWMHPDNNSLEIKQMLMELYLQYYFYPGIQQIIASYELDSQSYYTKKARQQIVEILEGKKTKEEFNAYLMHEKSLLMTYKNVWTEAAQIMKKQEIKNDTILRQIRDSIIIESANESAKLILESLQIEPELIKMIGLLNMKECIPILQQNLLLCPEEEYRTIERAYRWALARLGDKEQRRYIMDNFMDYPYFNHSDFVYFRDDEMVWRYIDINYHSNEEISILSDVSISSSLKAMSDVYPFIKNLPKELEYPYSNDMNDNYKWAKKLYEWLMANKDKIKFDYEGEKDFPWM